MQHDELARLQRAEEELLRVEAAECARLRDVASSLTGEWVVSSFFCCLLLLPMYRIFALGAGAAGVGAVAVAAAGSDVLRGAVDVVSGAAVAAGGVCARALTLLKLLHEHLMPEATKVPEGLDSRVSAFGPMVVASRSWFMRMW